MKRGFRYKSLYIFISIVLSLFLHLCMLIVMMKVTLLPNILHTDKKPDRRIQRISYEPLDLKKFELDVLKSSVPDVSPELPDEMNKKLHDTVGSLKSLGKSDGEYDIPIPDPPDLSTESPKLASIVAVDADSLDPDRMKFNRNFIPKLSRFDDAGYSYIPSKKKAGGFVNPVDMRVSLPPPKKKPEALPITPDTRLLPEEKVIMMDPLIDVEIYKYPLSRGGGFFRIDLSPNEKAAALRTFNKDVIFLLDVSGSIGRQRLSEFRKGLLKALPELKPEDRMNIVAFKSGNYPMFKVPMHPSKKNLQYADDFLFKMRHGGTTNIYSALEAYAGLKNRIAGRPLLIFLLSDGYVNTGKVVGLRDLINTISNKNSDGAGIYSYSCGDDRNSFLMDLMSYRNRGESINVPDIKRSNPDLTEFINAVSDVKVADLEYQISSNLSDSVFPKRLPNLYKDKTLSIYGRYEDESDAIGLRVTGRDSMGIRREIVIGGYIADAKMDTQKLAQKWARQYIYHLYSILSVKYDEKIKDEIHRIAARYQLDLPYLDKHLIPKRKNYIR